MLRFDVDTIVDCKRPSVGYSAFIRARLKFDGHSQRWLADQTGISRSRMQRLLHGDPAQRRPIRLNEQRIIFAVLQIDDHVATFATELMDLDPDAAFLSTMRIADMLSVLFRGLAGQIATAIRHIDGLEHGDIRPEYGAVIRSAVVRTIRSNCEEVARRRGLRLDAIFAAHAGTN